MLNQKNKYAPDVLDCIANLSNDEVFTSPKLANQMLDMVPQELFTNPRTKFLDPCCKSGVFLREIVKRLDRGLADIIPDRQARIDHILHKQVFGIAITELTAQLSRRTVYCSKYACEIKSGDVWISDENDDEHGIHETHSYSISEFTAEDVNDFCINPIQGNVRFNNQIKHNFDKNGTCKICGANKKSFDEHSHAYELIHINETRLEALKNMQWDLIISNPPYQNSTNKEGAQATPIYNKFIEQAKKLQPRYLAMIIPSRWMTGGMGLGKFRNDMINDKCIKELHDFINEKDCFSGVNIPGGVCYFLRDESHNDKCNCFRHTGGEITKSVRFLHEEGDDIFIRDERLLSIKEKVEKYSEPTMDTIVSSLGIYGLKSDAMRNPKKYGLKFSNTPSTYRVLGLNENRKRDFQYIDNYTLPDNIDASKYKVFMAEANGAAGTIGEGNKAIVGYPVLGKPNDICIFSFVQIGNFETETEATNLMSYIRTKFFRTMVGIAKQTQHINQQTYRFVPIQDFSKSWTDDELYKKYNLTQDEIDFIESMIKPMNDDGKNDETEE